MGYNQSFAIAAAGVSLTACIALHDAVAPRVNPPSVPVPAEAGRLAGIEVVAPFCDYITMELHFPRSAFAGREIRGTSIGQGEKISMRFAIARLDQSARGAAQHSEFQIWEATTDEIQGWANDSVFRMFGGTTLPAGKYQVNAELLESHPVFGELRPTLIVTSNFKHSPERGKC